MNKFAAFLLLLILLSLLSGCANMRNDNPLKVKCPACGYIWDHTPTEEY